jgi:hypothetical protein
MSRNTTTDDLDRRGMTAFSLFAALCLAGILTLFSQTSHRTEAQLHGERTSLNPTTEATEGLGDLLQATIEQGERASKQATATKKKDDTILLLR